MGEAEMNLLKNAPKFKTFFQNVQNVQLFQKPCAFHVLFRRKRRKIKPKFVEIVENVENVENVQSLYAMHVCFFGNVEKVENVQPVDTYFFTNFLIGNQLHF